MEDGNWLSPTWITKNGRPKGHLKQLQGHHGRFLAGKDAIVAATSPARRHCRPFSISQNLAKDQAYAALPPVAAL